jgi:hypothetical protein
MSDLKDLPLDDAIRLGWVLWDIRAMRFILTPPDPADVETLIRMGYVAVKDDQPVLTPAGLELIRVGIRAAVSGLRDQDSTAETSLSCARHPIARPPAR